jgi:hypothetical protein
MIAKLLVLHFIADFLLQPREMGVKKSSDIRWLGGHLAIQFLIFFPFTSVWFALANCTVHGVIDWYIWRGYKWSVHKRLYDAGNGKLTHSLMSDQGEWRFWMDDLFFKTIGFDQLLHGLTLVILAGYLL